jgi:RNA polymerase sigma-70 factor (ECF subfamily)
VDDVHDAALRNGSSPEPRPGELRRQAARERHGERSGFEEFFRAEQPRMIALAIALTGVPEVARDLAQESLVKAYRAWPSVRAMDRPGAWLRRVTINAATSWHRSNSREAAARARLRPDHVTEPPERAGQHFWEAVRALPERQRAAVALHYLEDMPIADVAAALDVAEGTVKASLFRARAALAMSLGLTTDGGE